MVNKMHKSEIKARRLLIKTTINILKVSSEHSKIDLSSIINEWDDILRELNDLLSEKAE